MIKLTGQNLIAGIPSSKGERSYQARDPRTLEESTLVFTDATSSEISKALDQAEQAFTIVQKDKIPDFLREVSNQILALGNQLLEVADSETALSRPRLISERTRTCDQLVKFADFIEDESFKEIVIERSDDTKSPAKPDIRRMLIPLGPVVVFPASNFPFAFGVCGGDSSSAWAAGCPVIVKAHPSHPATSELFGHAVNKAIDICDMPKGYFSLIHGKDVEVSKQLVTNPKVEAIGFTGSQSVGRAIFDLASARPKPIPVFAEMGCINPVFISTVLSDTAEQLANSITLGTGQFCTKPGVIFVKKDDVSLIDDVVRLLKKKEPGILLNETIKGNLDRVVSRSHAINSVDVRLGGHALKDKVSFENTVLVTDAGTYLEHEVLHKEHFGPVALFVVCDGESDFLKIAHTLEGQLTATIHVDTSNTESISELFHLLTRKVGRLIINGVPTGVEVCKAMHHGGPYPATTSLHTTSVGMYAIKRFLRPIAFQNIPKTLLPHELR